MPFTSEIPDILILDKLALSLIFMSPLIFIRAGRFNVVIPISSMFNSPVVIFASADIFKLDKFGLLAKESEPSQRVNPLKFTVVNAVLLAT